MEETCLIIKKEIFILPTIIFILSVILHNRYIYNETKNVILKTNIFKGVNENILVVIHSLLLALIVYIILLFINDIKSLLESTEGEMEEEIGEEIGEEMEG